MNSGGREINFQEKRLPYVELMKNSIDYKESKMFLEV